MRTAPQHAAGVALALALASGSGGAQAEPPAADLATTSASPALPERRIFAGRADPERRWPEAIDIAAGAPRGVSTSVGTPTRMRRGGCDEIDPVVAWVDDAPIESREFRLFVARHRAATIAYFQREHDVDDLRGFWSRDFDGVTPLAHVCERALRECVRHRLERRLAAEQDIIARADYAFVVEQLERENRRRREVAAAGGPVFGLVQYTEETWYRHYFSSAVLRTKAKLAATKLRPTEEALAAERAARAAEFGRSSSESEVRQFLLRELIDRAYGRMIGELVAEARVRVDEQAMQRLEIR